MKDLIIFCGLGLVCVGLFLLARNQMAYRIRMTFLYESGLDAYLVLPSYDEMAFSPKHYFRWTKAQWVAWVEAQP